MTNELTANLMEKVDARYYGKYRAFVADNADKENRGRLRLRIPDVLGKDVISGWALPCAPFGGAADQGFFYIPDKDAGVWVEFEQGILDYPIWVGTFWAKPAKKTTEVPKPADTQTPPTSKIIKTKNHTIELADKDGSEAITITDTINKNVLTLDSKGITVKDQNNNQITLEKGDLKLASDKIMIGAGAGSDHLVLGDTLQKLLDPWFQAIATHVHVGNLGAPTSPAASLAPAVPQLTSALSKKHVVE